MKKIKVDTKDILKKANQKPEQRKVTFVLEKELYDEFQAICEREGVAAARVMSELIAAFIQGDKKG